MNEPEKIILASDPGAAHQVAMTIWISRRGNYYIHEESARSDGATHSQCLICGAITNKGHSTCNPCYEKNRKERYDKLEKKVWDGETPLYSNSADEYFFDDCQISDYCNDNDCSIESLQLMICEPELPWQIEPEEYYQDILPEHGELNNPELEEAFERLNEVIAKSKPLSWMPGKYAAIVEEDNDGT